MYEHLIFSPVALYCHQQDGTDSWRAKGVCFIDANVFMSGNLFSDLPSRTLTACEQQGFQIVLSRQILDEHQSVADDLP